MLRAATFDSSAVIPAGKHLFPFRTEKLSLPGPMVLGGQPPGRVGRRRLLFERSRREAAFFRWSDRQRQALEVARVVREPLDAVAVTATVSEWRKPPSAGA